MSDQTEGQEAQTDFQDWFVNELTREEEPPEEAKSEAAPSDEPETPSEEAETEDTEAEASAEAPEEDEQEAPEPDSDTAEPDSTEEQPQTFTVSIGGKDEEVTLEELVSGYHRQSDYTRKTQALAEERKRLETERQAFASQQQQQSESITAMRERMAKQAGVLSNEEIEKLYNDDPSEWAVQRERRRAFEEQFESQKETSLKAQEDYLRQAVTDCWTKVPEVIPEWFDLDNSRGEIQQVARYVVAQGVPETQVQTIAEPLVWKIARKAMLYDEIQKAKPTIKKKVAEAPKMVKSGTPKTQKTAQADREKKAAARLKKTGSGFTDWLLESGTV